MAARKTAAKTTAASSTTATSKAKPETIAGIPITREEIEPLFGDQVPVFAHNHSCTFRSPLGLAAMKDAITPRLAELRAAKTIKLGDYPPPDGPDLYIELAGKQVGILIKAFPADPSRWMLAALFRGEGAAWGSHHALFLWFAKTILPWIGAEDVQHVRGPHDRTSL